MRPKKITKIQFDKDCPYKKCDVIYTSGVTGVVVNTRVNKIGIVISIYSGKINSKQQWTTLMLKSFFWKLFRII